MAGLPIIAAPSPNFDRRRSPIDMLILHYTGMPTGAEALARLRDPTAKVSAHYLIEEDGRVFALVDEAARAWHAGVARWRGDDDINSRSIGIELVNPGHDWGYRPFPAPQMAALERLCADISTRHPVPPRHVLGHSDVAPARKQDPGPLFDWARLARRGIGLWADPAFGQDALLDEVQRRRFADALAAFGYDMAAAKDNDSAAAAVVRAFHSHYRPQAADWPADRMSLALIEALLARASAGG
ncbi:MAG: N-acetylmuramoyl-L-alanine amidase [Sphingomonadales bacterium]